MSWEDEKADIKKRFPEDANILSWEMFLLSSKRNCWILTCEACGKRERFDSMKLLRTEKYVYELCGECGHIKQTKRKTLKCEICGEYEDHETDINVFHRGCRWSQVAKAKEVNGLAAFDPEALVEASRLTQSDRG